MVETKNCVEIYLLGLRAILPYAKNFTDKQLEKRIGKEKLLEVSEDLEGYILSGVTTKLSKNEKIALTCKALNCLCKYITSNGLPITIQTVIKHMNLISYAVNNSFPGYAASGLLRYTIIPTMVESRIANIETANA